MRQKCSICEFSWSCGLLRRVRVSHRVLLVQFEHFSPFRIRLVSRWNRHIFGGCLARVVATRCRQKVLCLATTCSDTPSQKILLVVELGNARICVFLYQMCLCCVLVVVVRFRFCLLAILSVLGFAFALCLTKRSSQVCADFAEASVQGQGPAGRAAAVTANDGGW